MLSVSIFPDLGVHRWIPPDSSAHRRERSSVSSHCIERQVSWCELHRLPVLAIVAPVAVSVAVKWLCAWRARVVESCERARRTVVFVKTRTKFHSILKSIPICSIHVEVDVNFSESTLYLTSKTVISLMMSSRPSSGSLLGLDCLQSKILVCFSQYSFDNGLYLRSVCHFGYLIVTDLDVPVEIMVSRVYSGIPPSPMISWSSRWTVYMVGNKSDCNC